MKLIKKTALATLASAAVLTAGIASANTTAEKAGQLGGRLTPMGSEKAGNAAGTIPAWEGGITRPPAGYKIGQSHIDPYASDKVLFQVTPANFGQYADRLSEGQKAMFGRYKSFRMDVYPSRRSASFPQRTYDFTKKNATSCKLIADGEGIQGCAEGFPFPIPNNAYEAIWNHKLKYKGLSVRSYSNQAAPTAGGAYTLVRLQEEILGLYYKPGNTSESINNALLYFKQDVLAPARLAGGVLLVHETLNAKAQPRQAWVYNPGQRRVRRAPNVAYDNPGTASDGLRTNDMTDMFNGAMDRFSWTLVGKKEMLIPYNDYKADASSTKVSDLVRPGHINPDYIRYELHRVWVVEAKLKAGQRHINSRRTFYLDEDSWQIVMVDHYDGQGKLWRYSEALPINYYEVPTLWTTLETHYDLKSGRYISGLLDNQDKPRDFSFQSTPADYSPQNLRDSGVR
ncbi:DUF1329 domain-containing protein [Arenimonas oryziterrae]|uniref:Outer membrane lipoprotein-sorting protein n=1 Tax=Arenimonas oryziterrae DSM 21050 = YC6267 TaxID=1121015 RepID=A0A091ATL9_9GAMM|nr:DUF1329 domain-containing protein [Arenimonas oryziterrae]KFN42502.1 hypothetical protein N789_12750 [Arenimonas oryziterrae DSM 21050 = YC6267]